jgi:hypothetical protein
MTIREQKLDTIAPVFATFAVHQTGGLDDLTDANVGEPVQLTGNYEVGPIDDGDRVLGKLIDLSLSDADVGYRVATVQIGGVCRLAVSATVPAVGDAIVGGASGTVKKAPALTGYDPAGGTIARGIVLAVTGTTDCVLLLS